MERIVELEGPYAEGSLPRQWPPWPEMVNGVSLVVNNAVDVVVDEWRVVPRGINEKAQAQQQCQRQIATAFLRLRAAGAAVGIRLSGWLNTPHIGRNCHLDYFSPLELARKASSMA